MSAGQYNLTVEQGATLSEVFTWKDPTGALIDLTGYSAKMQVRRAPGADELYLEASTGAGTIVLGGAAGTVTITVLAATTAALSFTTGSWDLVLTAGDGTVTRLVEGTATLDRSVTV